MAASKGEVAELKRKLKETRRELRLAHESLKGLASENGRLNKENDDLRSKIEGIYDLDDLSRYDDQDW